MINICNDQEYTLFKIIKNNSHKIMLRKYLKVLKNINNTSNLK